MLKGGVISGGNGGGFGVYSHNSRGNLLGVSDGMIEIGGRVSSQKEDIIKKRKDNKDKSNVSNPYSDKRYKKKKINKKHSAKDKVD